VVTYSTVKESFEDQILGCYCSFGIAAYNKENDSSKPMIYIPDVFIDEEQAIAFVDKCNSLSLDPEHLLDVIYDSI